MSSGTTPVPDTSAHQPGLRAWCAEGVRYRLSLDSGQVLDLGSAHQLL
jgi:hypothetical protein